MKGQGHRSSGREVPFGFEGGQMPLARRLPKRGFHNRFRKVFEIVNVGVLAAFGEGATVDVEALVPGASCAAREATVKLLGEGEAPKRLTVKVHAASAGARKKIEAAGGRLEVIW